MANTFGLIGPISAGERGERIYALLHTDEGEILQQFSEKSCDAGPVREIVIESFPNVHEVETIEEPRRQLGFAIGGDISEDELLSFLTSQRDDGNIALTIDGLYAQPLTAASIIAHPLYDTLMWWLYTPDV